MERFLVADGLGQSHGGRNDAAALANMNTKRQRFEVCGDGDASGGCHQYGFKTLRVIPQQQLEPVTPSLSVVGSAMMSTVLSSSHVSGAPDVSAGLPNPPGCGFVSAASRSRIWN